MVSVRYTMDQFNDLMQRSGISDSLSKLYKDTVRAPSHPPPPPPGHPIPLRFELEDPVHAPLLPSACRLKQNFTVCSIQAHVMSLDSPLGLPMYQVQGITEQFQAARRQCEAATSKSPLPPYPLSSPRRTHSSSPPPSALFIPFPLICLSLCRLLFQRCGNIQLFCYIQPLSPWISPSLLLPHSFPSSNPSPPFPLSPWLFAPSFF